MHALAPEALNALRGHGPPGGKTRCRSPSLGLQTQMRKGGGIIQPKGSHMRNEGQAAHGCMAQQRGADPRRQRGQRPASLAIGSLQQQLRIGQRCETPGIRRRPRR